MKIKSHTIKNYQKFYKNTSADNPLQLFLSDYANLFVAKVVKISKEVDKNIIPKYYQEKKFRSGGLFLNHRFKRISKRKFHTHKR